MSKFKIGLALAAVLVGVPVGCSILGTATSVATAPGRVVQKTLQTDNIISNYEGFFNRKAQYDARLNQAQGHTLLLATEQDPAEKTRLRIELSAMKQSCRDLATQYNADAAKLNRKLFRDSQLPANLSETACEVS